MPRRHSGGLKCKHGPENSFLLTSPLGILNLVCCPKGVHGMTIQGVDCDDNFTPNPMQDVKIESQKYADNGYTYKSALMCTQWLQCYFHNLTQLSTFQPPLVCHIPGQGKVVSLHSHKHKVSFTEHVWGTLASCVNVGRTVSYGELAVMCGHTAKSSRAVGQAMRNNPVSIIVPCHRVILGSGNSGNYSGGTKNSVKAWLLRHEGSIK